MKNKYHFIGIGGIGMSSLARILLDKQQLVAGSDLHLSKNTAQLQERGAQIKEGHFSENIGEKQIVVVSSSIKNDNPELMAAKNFNCPILHRSDLLTQLMKNHKSFVCTGTHGKTTTTALLTYVLTQAGFDPTFSLGGMLENSNGKMGSGEFFVAEADESDGSFLKYNPDGAIVTNVEPEHMDYFQTTEKLHKDFESFFSTVKNYKYLFYCGDDKTLVSLAKNRGVSYGFSDGCMCRVSNYKQRGWKSCFDITFENKVYRDVVIPLIGKHNALNASAAFCLSLRLAVSEENIRHALEKFPGVERRCHKRMEKNSVLFIDDYGHHPTEIEKTINAIKSAVGERRLVVLFQPHRYSRTQNTLQDYGHIFDHADQVYITDIYSASEDPIPGVTHQSVIDIVRSSSTVPCDYVPRKECKNIDLRPHDVFLTLGAGDVTYVTDECFEIKKRRVGLIFGGKSCEHEISLRSARFVSESLDRSLYDVSYFGIDKQGLWISGKEAQDSLSNKKFMDASGGKSVSEIMCELDLCDVFLPILHGTYGEDGTLQGLFEMMQKPYVCPDYKASAIAMDKVLSKRLAASNGVPTPKDIVFGCVEWIENKEECVSRVLKELPFPLYVKPVCLGSSVGVSCVRNEQDLMDAIENAFLFDTRVMVEEGKDGCRELEFAVLGNSNGYGIQVPMPGEKLAKGLFVDYEKKYGSTPVETTIYPDLDSETLLRGKEMARRAYTAIGCSCMSRVDFLLDKEGVFWFFEINTIPGMQSLSLFPKIWKRDGVGFTQLLDRLIILAMHRQREKSRHMRCLPSC